MYKVLEKLKLNSRKPNWLEYLIPLVLWCIWLIIYKYIDFQSLTIWSTTILDCIVDGNLYDYYDIVHQNIHGTPHLYCGYNYIILIPWAIWNIPIWFIQRFFHIEILGNVFMLLWSHLFLLVTMGAIICFSNKIVALFNVSEEYSSWNTYLILTFPFSFMAIVLAGQTDIIVIAITVIAVYFLLIDKQGIFLLFMAISISAKPFFVFSYIAVILLIEKNIIKIALKVVSSAAFAILFQAVYNSAPMFAESYAAGTGDSIIEQTLRSAMSVNITYQAPYVIIGLVIIYFVAYCINFNKSRHSKYYIIYMMVAPMIVYFCFAQYEFYRMIYLVPFLMILITINSSIYRLNIILESVISVVGLFLMIYYKWTASLAYINHGLMSRLGIQININECAYNSIYDLLIAKAEKLPLLQNIGAGVFVTALGVFLIINIPFVTAKIKQPIVKCERWLYWLNTATLYIMMTTLLLCYFNLIP